jgi:MFS family permease
VLAGAALLATSTPSTAPWLIAFALGVIGLGMGSSWPIYVVATQNTVDHAQVGVATAVLIFFRTMGGSIGVTGLGAVFSARLSTQLSGQPGVDVDSLRHDDGTVSHAVEIALASSLQSVFLALLPLAIVLLALAFQLEERPLRSAQTTLFPSP